MQPTGSSNKTDGSVGSREAWEQIMKVWAGRGPQLAAYRGRHRPQAADLALAPRTGKVSQAHAAVLVPDIEGHQLPRGHSICGQHETGSKDADYRICSTPAQHLARCPQLTDWQQALQQHRPWPPP